MTFAIKNRFLIIIGLFQVVLSLLISPCLYSQETLTLHLNGNHSFRYAGYYAALEKGFYKNKGIHVDIKHNSDRLNPVYKVVSKEAQYGIGTCDLLIKHAQGNPVVLLASMFQHSPNQVFASSNILALEDLEGKKIMIEPQSEELLFLLKSKGILTENTHIYPFNYSTQKNAYDTIDAVLGSITSIPYYLYKASYSYTTFNTKLLGVDLYGDNLFTSSDELKNHPKRVKAFKEASIEGWKYAVENSDEIVELIVRKYTSVYSDEFLQFEASQTIPLLKTEMVEIGYNNPIRWEQIVKVFSSYGLLPIDYSINGFVFDEYSKQKSVIFHVVFVFSLIFIVSIILIIYIYRLNRKLKHSIKTSKDVQSILAKNEKNYSILFNSISDAIFIQDTHGIFLEVNNGAEKMYGYTRFELIGKTPAFLSAPHKNNLQQVSTLLKKVFDTGETEVLEFWGQRKDGETFFNEIACNKGVFLNIEVIITIARDVTARKKAEEELRVSEEKFSKVFKNSPDIIILTSIEDGKIIEANNSILTIAGYSLDEIIGKTTTELNFWGRDIDRYKFLSEIQTKGKVSNLECGFRKKNGEIITGLISGEIVHLKESTFVLCVVHDITQRKKFEAEIKESEERFRTIIATSPDALIITSLDGVIEYVSPQALTIFKFLMVEDMIGKNIYELIHSDYHQKLKNVVDIMLKGNLSRPSESLMMKTNGITFVAEYNTNVLRNQNHMPTGILYFIRDISERKQTEMLIKLSEEKYRLLAENSSDVIWVLNLKNEKFSYISPAIYQLRGFTAKEAINMNLKESVTPASYDFIIEQLNKLVPCFVKDPSNPYYTIAEIQQPHKNGTKIWVEVSTRFRMNEQGEVEIIGVSRNIDQRKKDSETLNEITEVLKLSEEKYREMTELLPQIIFELDLDGNITYLNKQAYRITGYSEEESLIGYNMLNFFVPDDREKVYQNNQLSILGDKNADGHEYSFFKKDGSIINVMIYSNPIIKDNKRVGLRGIIVDITEIKRVQLELKRNEVRFRELNATKDKFFSIIAHDLKSPFNGIIGFSELLVQEINDKSYKNVIEFANIILSSSNRAMELLTNLMDWANSQTGRMEFNPEFFDLVTQINEVVDLLKNSAEQKQITFVQNLPPNVVCFADKAMISTVLRNLLSNAIKFTYPKGAITITLTKFNDEIQISIADKGVGISEKYLDQLFKIDGGISTVGTQNEKGTGLGLILCKEFIEKHNGRIGVSSKVGVGSTFFFTIPLSKDQFVY